MDFVCYSVCVWLCCVVLLLHIPKFRLCLALSLSLRMLLSILLVPLLAVFWWRREKFSDISCVCFVFRAEPNLTSHFNGTSLRVPCFRVQAEIASQIIHDNRWKKTKVQLFTALNKTEPNQAQSQAIHLTELSTMTMTMAYGCVKVKTIKWIFQQL